MDDKIFYREAAIESPPEGDSRTVVLSFSSEAPVNRGGISEILRHGEDNVDLTRLNSIGTLLFNHDADRPIGKIESADVENGRGVATVTFDDDEFSEVIYKKVKSGSLKGVSVGYRVYKWKSDRANKAEYAEKWEPLEISIVSVPADSSVGVDRSAESKERDGDSPSVPENTIKEERKNQMSEITTENGVVESSGVVVEFSGVLESERARCAEIQTLGARYGVENETVNEWIRKGSGVPEVKDFILERMASANRPPVPNNSADVSITRAEEDSYLERAAEVISGKTVDERGRYEGMENISLHGFCRHMLHEKGTSFRELENMDAATLVRAAMDSTGQLTALTDNVANKSLSTWQEAGVTYPAITSSNVVKDFRKAREYTLSAFGSIEPVKEGENVKYKTFSDEYKEFGVELYRIGFMMTEQMLINDDLSMLGEYTRKVTDGIYRTINKQVYDKLFSADNIYDGQVLFHADHHNLAATGTKMSIASFAAANDAMAKQRDFSGQAVLNIRPEILVCDTSLDVYAGQLLGSSVDPTKYNAVPNPMRNRYTIVSDPIISTYDANSYKNWFVMAKPSVEPVIRISYLQKYQRPTITSYTDLENLCIKYQVTMGFGVNVVGFRGIYKNPGVAIDQY